MNYQGRLDDANGDPVADGNYSVTFRLFNASSGGSSLWDETQTVTTVDGVFSVLLGSLDTIPEFIWYQDSSFLEIQPQGSDPVFPRSLLSVVPYSWRSKNADLVGGMTGSELEESAEIQSALSAHTAIPNAHHDKTIDASQLIIGTLAEGRLPQGAIDSSEIELESVTSNRLLDEAGIAHTHTEYVTLPSTGTMVVIDSAVITVPRGGWILIQANGRFLKDVPLGPSNTSATVSLSPSKISHVDTYSARFSVPTGQSEEGPYTENFMISQVLQVGVGTTKVYLIASGTSTNPFTRVEQIHLNTLYFPTAYGNIDVFSQ
jgi:hypothetical protein